MHTHSIQERGNDISVHSSLWPDCEIDVDPYRLPVHIAFDAPCPGFTRVVVKRTVSLYKGFVVITDRLGATSCTLRIIALADFDGVVVRVGFNSTKYRQIGSAVYLHHAAFGLDLPLYASVDCDDTAALWLAWSRALGVPAMSFDANGEMFDPFNRVGELCVGSSLPRRPVMGNTGIRQQSCRSVRRLTPARTVASASKRSNVYSPFG